MRVEPPVVVDSFHVVDYASLATASVAMSATSTTSTVRFVATVFSICEEPDRPCTTSPAGPPQMSQPKTTASYQIIIITKRWRNIILDETHPIVHTSNIHGVNRNGPSSLGVVRYSKPSTTPDVPIVRGIVSKNNATATTKAFSSIVKCALSLGLSARKAPYASTPEGNVIEHVTLDCNANVVFMKHIREPKTTPRATALKDRAVPLSRGRGRL